MERIISFSQQIIVEKNKNPHIVHLIHSLHFQKLETQLWENLTCIFFKGLTSKVPKKIL